MKISFKIKGKLICFQINFANIPALKEQSKELLLVEESLRETLEIEEGKKDKRQAK